VTRVFADTTYFPAFLNSKDELHNSAKEAAGAGAAIVTTDYVLVEVANAVSRSSRRNEVAQFIRDLQSDPQCTVVPASPQLFDAGLDMYARRQDKEWSLTDCISFLVMNAYALTDALTEDHHFEQAGFGLLLRRDTK
jgi:predicted nucleic acid-binding protein